MVLGPPRSTSTRSMVSSRRNAEEPSKKDSTGTGIDRVAVHLHRNEGRIAARREAAHFDVGARLAAGRFGVHARHQFQTSAVLLGEACFSCSSVAVVIEKAGVDLAHAACRGGAGDDDLLDFVGDFLGGGRFGRRCSLLLHDSGLVQQGETAAATADNKNGLLEFSCGLCSLIRV
jgi:hypothetical protein